MNMDISIRLILYFVLFHVTTTTSITISEISGCPFTSNLLDYCNSEFDSCINRKSKFEYCIGQFFDCSNDKLPVSEEECSDHIKDVYRILNQTQKIERKEVEIGLPEYIRSTVSEIDKDCDLVISKYNTSVSNVLRILSSENKCIIEYESKLDKALIETYKKTSSGISFGRSRCGWQYGPIGIVVWRYWMRNQCGLHHSSINHCCAEHLNCYMEQNGKETCDTSLSNCYKKAISPMTSYKLSCESLFNNSSGEFEDKDYEAFQVSKIHTEIETFDGEENQEIQVSDIVNFTITRIKVFRLSSNGLVDSNIREKFNRNFYKYGWPKRVIIDSCAMIFEECRRYENMNICFKKLQICLDDIEEKSEEFQVTLKEFNLMVSSRIQNATPEETIKSIEEIKKIIKKLKEDIEILESNQFPLWASYLTLIVEICFIFYTIVKCFLKTWEKKKLRMDPLVPVESGESLVRYNASSQQAVIEHDGTE